MSDIKTKIVNCPKHGDFEAKYVSLFGRDILQSKCPKCAEESAERAKHSQKAAESYEQQRRISLLNQDIPRRFQGVNFENFLAPENSGEAKALRNCKAFAEKFPELSEMGAGMIFCGSLGTGKTHLAISIARYVTESGFSARYLNLMQILKLVRETWGRESEPDAERHVISELTNCDLLIIDEVGVQMGTENEKVILFEIINGRYENMNSTIVISNLDKAGISELISERSVDRITEGGGTLVFNWPSYRNKKAAA